MTPRTGDLAILSRSPQLSTRNGIAYRRFGEGPPLILLHGSSGSWTHWVRNIGALSRLRTVFALDLPGFGASGDVPPDISVDAYVEIVAAALAQMSNDDEPIDVVGFSFGGVIAAGVAALLRERLRRLSLLTPSGFSRPTGRKLELPRRKDFGTADGGRRAFHRAMLSTVMLAQKESIDEQAIDIQASNVERSRFDGSHISWSGRLLGYLGLIDRPIQLIYGERDPMPFPSAAARAAACRAVKPTIRLDWVEGAGHWLQYERAPAVNRLLADFLGAIKQDQTVERGLGYAI